MNETALAHLVTRVLTAGPEATAQVVLAGLPGSSPEAAEAVFVVDPERRLLGVVPLTTLLAAAPGTTLAELMRRDVRAAAADDDQEQLAHDALFARLAVLPVADGAGRLLGAVPGPALLAIMRREHIEDLHRLAGITGEGARSRDALEAAPLVRARHRLPWLLVGLAGSGLATLLMSRFEATFEAKVAVAFFVPGIVYLADAVGTQAEAIAVRGLSLSRLSLGALLAGELRTGFLIGLVLGALAAGGTLLAVGEPRLSVAVGLSITAAATMASAVGILFPWVLHRAGTDPAFGSGPVATVVQDVLTVAIYLALVELLVAP